MNQDCKMCVVMAKVFGQDFEGCGHISRRMTEDAVQTIKNKMESMRLASQRAMDSGKITKEEYDLICVTLEGSFVYAAAGFPIEAVARGAKVPPQKMIELVFEHTSKALGRNGD